MRRGLGRLVALVLGVLLVLAFLHSQRPHPPEAAAATGAPAVDVQVVEARERTVPSLYEAVGTVRSVSEVELAARTMAEVLEVSVAPGDEVRAGALLVTLDSAAARAAVAEARAASTARKKSLEEAERELERTRALFAREARTQRELDTASTAFEQAEALSAAAEEAQAAAQVALDDTALKAPFDGVVAERAVDPGDLAAPGRVLLHLYDPAALRLEVTVPATLMAGLALGDELAVRLDAAREGSSPPAVGRVEEILPSVDPATRTVLVKLRLPPAPEVRPGMFGRVEIPVGERRALVVPAGALVVRGQLEVVFTAGDDGRAHMQVVRSGRRLADGSVELLSGLAGPQQVVVQGASALRDGAPIRVEGAR